MAETAKRVVLTGASKGLGLALAREFVKRGHGVEGCSRSGLPTDEARCPVSAVDVSSREQVFKWADRLLQAGHIPDVLITNAGLINEPAPLWMVPGEDLQALIATNVLGTAYAVQAFLPAMMERGSGMIITLSSGWGRSADADFAPYCASKFAVEGLTSSLAKELPASIGVVTLSPGIVRTDMLFRCWGEKALDYELPEAWAKRAVPFMLGLNPEQNGQQFTVPAP